MYVYFLFTSCSLSQMRDEAGKHGVPPIREAIWQYYIGKSINNLHVVLAMSPVGDTLRTRCRNFPGMVNNCSIDWFMAWPRQALEAVATVFLGHEDVRKFHSSPGPIGIILCGY